MHDHPDRVEAALKDGADARNELDRRRFLQRATILVGGVMATSVATMATGLWVRRMEGSPPGVGSSCRDHERRSGAPPGGGG